MTSGTRMNIATTITRLNTAKIVSPVGMMPILSAEKCPSVAMVSGIEPARPPCQMMKPE
ncbi:Uncharacterised protein [Bordetella pertussis]|nr:Uncharacterised protein [Bordetella pertussis]CFP60985.1 Uncharacterised protein [Bordetella pertussis]